MQTKAKIAAEIIIGIAKILIALAIGFGVGYYFAAVFTATDWFTLVKSFMQFVMMIWLAKFYNVMK